jgi:hypothetical protein
MEEEKTRFGAVACRCSAACSNPHSAGGVLISDLVLVPLTPAVVTRRVHDRVPFPLFPHCSPTTSHRLYKWALPQDTLQLVTSFHFPLFPHRTKDWSTRRALWTTGNAPVDL